MEIMKTLILIVFGGGVIAGSALYLNRPTSNAIPVEPVSQDAASGTVVGDDSTQPESAPVHAARPAPALPEERASGARVPLPVIAPLDRIALTQAVDLLTSSEASSDQKRASWKQLRDRGCLDQAIAELERRRADNSASPEDAAVLGHAYLQKCGTISDVREQGILAMQADKLFDTALSLDPSNWEARFTKAVGLSYWPASMGKSDEVVQLFTTLIQQQENQTPQPQFAEPYVWLGNQYQKAGRADDAQSVWQRGAALFPANPELKNKLASLPAP